MKTWSCHLPSCDQIVFFGKQWPNLNFIFPPLIMAYLLTWLRWDTQGDPCFVNCRFWRSYSFSVWGDFLFQNFIRSLKISVLISYDARGTMLIPRAWPCTKSGKSVSPPAGSTSAGLGRPGPFFWDSPIGLSWRFFLSPGVHFLKLCFHVCFWWCISFSPFLLGLWSRGESEDSVEENVHRIFLWFWIYVMPKPLNDAV